MSDEDLERALYERAPVAYMIVSRGLIQRVNHAAIDLLGRPREGLASYPLAALVDPGDLPAMLEHLRACAADGATRSVEVDLSAEGATGPRRVLFTSHGGQLAGAEVCASSPPST